jgi:hypothetical protein
MSKKGKQITFGTTLCMFSSFLLCLLALAAAQVLLQVGRAKYFMFL